MARPLRRVETISPSQLSRAAITRRQLVIRGSGFEPGMRVQIGPLLVPPADVTVSDTTLTLTLRKPLSHGLHQVRAKWADGTQLCAPAPLAVSEQPCRLLGIPFEKGFAALSGTNAAPGAERALVESMVCLSHHQDRDLLVLGFASVEGRDDLNRTLSVQRAAVVSRQVTKHLPQMRVRSVGLGTALPVKLGEQEGELAANRRAVIVLGSSAPCASIRVPVEATGGLAPMAQALVAGQARCFDDRRVTQALLVLPQGDPDAERAEVEQHAAALSRTVRRLFVENTAVDSQLLIQPVFASAEDRSAIGAVLGLAEHDATSPSAEIHPIAWTAGETALTFAQPPDPSCPPEQPSPLRPEPAVLQLQPDHQAEPAPPTRAPRAFVQFRAGALRGLEQTHLGGSLRAGARVASSGRYVDLLMGLKLGVFVAEHPYRYTDDLTTPALMPLNAALALSVRATPLRFELSLEPGLLLPVASAFFGDANGTLAWTLHPSVELLGSGGGGVSVWRAYEIDPHWHGEIGAGWWF
ncbi:MAG: hypothetical protein HY744_05035 [Deltaproteobacteria bacterium]|nr:hypothetical protein [Deltaproteobacteria bacterium]